MPSNKRAVAQALDSLLASLITPTPLSAMLLKHRAERLAEAFARYVDEPIIKPDALPTVPNCAGKGYATPERIAQLAALAEREEPLFSVRCLRRVAGDGPRRVGRGLNHGPGQPGRCAGA